MTSSSEESTSFALCISAAASVLPSRGVAKEMADKTTPKKMIMSSTVEMILLVASLLDAKLDGSICINSLVIGDVKL